MALSLSLDLHSATLDDLEAFLASARSAGMDGRTTVTAQGSTITVSTDAPAASTGAQETTLTPDPSERVRRVVGMPAEVAGGVGEAAVRSVIDILTGRQEPPRR